ncbi:MAG TPA: hypothetical protein VFY69_01445 [Solirubrobacterales bacterium]|nr:hypothetical protein [Solirubrobacterales bacterium]
MSRKLMVLALAALLAVAVALPVVAQERTVTSKLQKISKRALKKSKTALRVSRDAARRARAAGSEAQAAGEAAGRAAQAAAGAQAAIDSTRVRAATAPGVVATGSEEFVALAGGPSVQVTVPPSGLIEVWAQATISEDGAVAIYEDGQPLPGQGPCGPEGAEALFAVEGNPGEPIAVATPAGAGLGICGSIGPPAPVLLQTTPGAHTYELRYADCGCGGGAPEFSDRRLFVGPRL